MYVDWRPSKQGDGLYGNFSGGNMRAYKQGGFGMYEEGIGTLRESGGDCGGGAETLVVKDAVSVGNGQLNNISMSEQANTLDTMHDQQCVLRNIVRRLTPLECERLQGYPDGWTDIGEWMDTKGKKHKDADSPRYKALGNSIALPFWKYLLKRISAQYERDATLGSLFDGIGGFPLCWEQINGKGSARWASEIDEFPMALTKLRFPE